MAARPSGFKSPFGHVRSISRTLQATYDVTMKDVAMDLIDIEKLIIDVPDYPKPGILFKDITPILKEPSAFASVISHMAHSIPSCEVIAAVEARGFIFGSALALYTKKPLILLRKPGKLPRKTFTKEYALEYGVDSIQIHQDAVEKNARYVIVDDVLATGGTALASADLINEHGGIICGFGFILTISALSGPARISANYPTATIASLLTT